MWWNQTSHTCKNPSSWLSIKLISWCAQVGCAHRRQLPSSGINKQRENHLFPLSENSTLYRSPILGPWTHRKPAKTTQNQRSVRPSFMWPQWPRGGVSLDRWTGHTRPSTPQLSSIQYPVRQEKRQTERHAGYVSVAFIEYTPHVYFCGVFVWFSKSSCSNPSGKEALKTSWPFTIVLSL